MLLLVFLMGASLVCGLLDCYFVFSRLSTVLFTTIEDSMAIIKIFMCRLQCVLLLRFLYLWMALCNAVLFFPPAPVLMAPYITTHVGTNS